MVEREKEELQKVPSKSIQEYPDLFRGAENENISRAMRYWKKRNHIISSYKPNGKINNDLYMSLVTLFCLCHRISKNSSGRGRKRVPWVVQLHEDIFNEFSRLLSSGSTQTFCCLSRRISFKNLQVVRTDQRCATRSLISSLRTILVQSEWSTLFFQSAPFNAFGLGLFRGAQKKWSLFR